LKAALWQMDVLNFEICIRQRCMDKNVKRLFWLQLKACTKRGNYLYKPVQIFKSVPTKEILQKILCDPQNEHVQVLCSQYIGKCKESVTVLVRTFILILSVQIVYSVQLNCTDSNYRERERLLYMLLYSILSVQIVYSVQLNCTDSNYREREWLSSVLLYSILSVQIVYSVQMNCTDSNYRETEWLLCWVSYWTAHWVYR
jgi:hypothetical protein